MEEEKLRKQMLKYLQGKGRSWLPLWPPEGLDAVGSSPGCRDGAASCAQGDFMAESSWAGAGRVASPPCLILTAGHLSLGGSAAFTRLAPWTLPQHLPLTAAPKSGRCFQINGQRHSRGTQGRVGQPLRGQWGPRNDLHGYHLFALCWLFWMHFGLLPCLLLTYVCFNVNK